MARGKYANVPTDEPLPASPKAYGSVPTQAPPAYAPASPYDDAAQASSSRGPADDIPDDFKYGTSVSQCSIEIRMGFLRKVYGILVGQLVLTSVVSGLFMYVSGLRAFVQNNPWAMIVSFVGTIGFLIGVFARRRSYPLNFYLLFGFTVFEAYTVGSIASFYRTSIVLEALLITLGLFIALSAFTLQSKRDFSGMGPFLYAAVWALIFSSFIAMFFPHSSAFTTVYAGIAAVVFSFYIIYDTYMIFNLMSPEDYVVASISLYLDIINLFLQILRLLNNSDNN